MAKKPDRQTNPGPDPERLKIDGDWEDAMKDAIDKERPEGGWPDEDDDEKKTAKD